VKSKIWLILFGLLVVYSQCSFKREAIGGSDEIYVLATDEMKEALQVAIDTTFSYGMRTPEFQHYFRTKWQPVESFPNMLHFKNIILLADLKKPNFGYEVIKKLLTPEKLKLVEQDSIHIFAIEDGWAKGQMVILIAGKDIDHIRRNIMEQRGWLFGKFEKKFDEVQSRYLYSQVEPVKLTKYLWKKYGWTMRIQHDYMVIKEAPQRKFVWLGRGIPYRWISVTWEDGIQTAWLTPNGLFEKRQQIGTFYGDNLTDKRFLGFNYTRLGQYDALRMYGLWYQEKETRGGPFATYAFYDKHSDRTFIIDILMYAPGEKITIMFRGVEIMAKTFTTNYTGKF